MATVLLSVIKGPGTGAVHPVTGPATLGRGTGADIVIADEAVSRVHASVRVDGQTVVLEDQESSNGTFVNGERITAARRLAPGDVVRIGGTELEVRVETLADPMTPTTPTVIQNSPES
jgi:pSer/pThr/pTyr-binding forkhead associated (FHA) protein